MFYTFYYNKSVIVYIIKLVKKDFALILYTYIVLYT